MVIITNREKNIQNMSTIFEENWKLEPKYSKKEGQQNGKYEGR